MLLGRSRRTLALAGWACLLTATASCDDDPDHSEGGEVRIERVFSAEESVLVCVTAVAPPGLSDEELDAVYERWLDTGDSREGYVTTYLFRFEDEPDQSARYMFALVFSGDPNGLAAAASHREQEYTVFREHLQAAGFTNVSLQSNLLHIDGAPERSHVDHHH